MFNLTIIIRTTEKLFKTVTDGRKPLGKGGTDDRFV